MANITLSNPDTGNDHTWTHEVMGAYLTGGLDTSERERFDAHVNACPECFDAFTEARDADREFQRTLVWLMPREVEGGFEKRIVQHVREHTMKRWMHPMVKRAGYGIAAAVALAATGVLGQYAMRMDGGMNNPLSQSLLANADAADGKTPAINLRGISKSEPAFAPTTSPSSAAAAPMASGQTEKVTQLVADAHTLYNRQQYKEASDLLAQAITLDPQNVDANFFKRMVDDRVDIREYDRLTAVRSRDTFKFQVDSAEHLIPYADLMVYPDDWIEITKARAKSADDITNQALQKARGEADSLAGMQVASADGSTRYKFGTTIANTPSTQPNAQAVGGAAVAWGQTVLPSTPSDTTVFDRTLADAQAVDNRKDQLDVSRSVAAITGGTNKFYDARQPQTGVPAKKSDAEKQDGWVEGGYVANVDSLKNAYAGKPADGPPALAINGPAALGGALVQLPKTDRANIDYGDGHAITTDGTLKSGTGTLALSGANTYSGGTSVAAGTLVVPNARANPAAAPNAGYLSYSERPVTLGGVGEFAGNVTIAGKDSYFDPAKAVASNSSKAGEPLVIGNASATNGVLNLDGGTLTTGRAVVDENGNLKGLTVTNPGAAYTDAPAVTLTGGGLVISNGSLTASGANGGANSTFNFNGGTLKASAAGGRGGGGGGGAGLGGGAAQNNRDADKEAAKTYDVRDLVTEEKNADKLTPQAVPPGSFQDQKKGTEQQSPASKVVTTYTPPPLTAGNSPPRGNPTPTPPAQQPAPTPAQDIAVLKVIRSGNVEFEVRSFDDSYQTIASVVGEEGGFISSTSSDKLPNGKVRGVIVVRVPPDHLDRFLMKIRALGELKSLQLESQDVTKQYTDLDSELRALRAMESRLIDLIKTGKGEIKDLVEAERQLGDYRVRIEKIEGEIRYYNNLVGMATVNIAVYEKDIQKPTAASEQENVSLSLETEDVETKYADARKILDDAKGRIVESELKKYDADQLSGHIVADIPPDKADFVSAQLKQLGKVAEFNRDKRQTTTGGEGAPTVQVEEKDTRFTISMYNLANIAPRETTSLTVAVGDVEGAYKKILARVRKDAASATPAPAPAAEPKSDKPAMIQATGRVVASNLTGEKPEQMAADIRADVRAEEADAVIQEIRGAGEVLASTTTENKDTTTMTSAKQGISLHLVSMASVQPHESTTLIVAVDNVESSYREILSLLKPTGGAENLANNRVISSSLGGQQADQMSADIRGELRAEQAEELLGKIKAMGEPMANTISSSPDGSYATWAKRGLSLRLISIAGAQARETQSIHAVTADVVKSYAAFTEKLQDLVSKKSAHIVSSQLNENNPLPVTASLVFDVRREQVPEVQADLAAAGIDILSKNVIRSQDTFNTLESKVRFIIDPMLSTDVIAPRETRSLSAVTSDVTKSYGLLMEKLQDMASKKTARILNSQLNESDPSAVTASLRFEVNRNSASDIAMILESAGIEVTSKNVTTSQDLQNTLDTKVLFSLDNLFSSDRLPPRQTTVLGLEVDSVPKAMATVRSLEGGPIKEVEYTMGREQSGKEVGHIVLDFPVNDEMKVLSLLRDLNGTEKVNQVVKYQVPDTRFSKERIDVTFSSREGIVEAGKGVGDNTRAALATTAAALIYSLRLVIVGVLFIAPWLLIGWALWKILRRKKATAPA